MMTGKIVKGIAGFYYVNVVESGIYECKAKGIFRKEKKKPLVGDNVRIEVLNEEEKIGNLVEILPRKNELIRPAVANVDQAVVIFALEDPAPNSALLDRFLLMMKQQEVPVLICFNKQDLVSKEQAQEWEKIYRDCGYEVLLLSAQKQQGVELLKQRLAGKTTVAAGPSGVGKSSLTNLLQEEIEMETGEISRKLKRGKHTTRHSQLICLNDNTYLMDTPGFSSLYTEEWKRKNSKNFSPNLPPMRAAADFRAVCISASRTAKSKRRLRQEKFLRPAIRTIRAFIRN